MLTQKKSGNRPPGGPRGAQDGAPLFFIPGHDGAAIFPPPVARRVGQVRSCHDGLRYPGLSGEEAPLNRVEDLASCVIGQIRRVCPQGPYSLCGYSFGGVVAYEAAQQLRASGLDVEELILWDSWIHSSITVCGRSMREAMSELILRLKRRDATEKRRFLCRLFRNKWKSHAFRCREKLRSMTISPLPGASNGLKGNMRERSGDRVAKASIQAYRAYSAKPFAGDAVLFRAAEAGGVFNKSIAVEGRGWDTLISGHLEVIEIPGSHLDIWEEPSFSILADMTADWLRKRAIPTSHCERNSARDEIKI